MTKVSVKHISDPIKDRLQAVLSKLGEKQVSCRRQSLALGHMNILSP